MDRPEETRWNALACCRCFHSAESHMYGDPLSCAFCALGPRAHAVGVGCSLYTPRSVPHSECCREPGCACAGSPTRRHEAGRSGPGLRTVGRRRPPVMREQLIDPRGRVRAAARGGGRPPAKGGEAERAAARSGDGTRDP